MDELGPLGNAILAADGSAGLLNEMERLRRGNEEGKRRLAVQNGRLVDLSLKVSKEIVIVYSLLEFNKAIFGTQEAAVLYGSTLDLLDRAFGLKNVCLFAMSVTEEQLVLRASSVEALFSLAGTSPPVAPGLAKGSV